MNKLYGLFGLLEEANEFNLSIYDSTLLESLNDINKDSSRVILSGKLLMIYGYYEEYFRKVNNIYWECIKDKKSRVQFDKFADEIVQKYKPTFKSGEEAKSSYKLYYDALSSLHNQKIGKVSSEIFLERIGILKFSDIVSYSNFLGLKKYNYPDAINLNLPKIEAVGIKQYQYSGEVICVTNPELVYKAKHDEFINIRNSIAHTGQISKIDFNDMYTDTIYTVFSVFQIYTKQLICDVLIRTRGKKQYTNYDVKGTYILCHAEVSENYKYVFYKTGENYYIDKIKSVMKNSQFITDITDQKEFGIELEHKLRMSSKTKIYFI